MLWGKKGEETEANHDEPVLAADMNKTEGAADIDSIADEIKNYDALHLIDDDKDRSEDSQAFFSAGSDFSSDTLVVN